MQKRTSGPQFSPSPRVRLPRPPPMHQPRTTSKLAQARLVCWHALVESLSSQGYRTEQACQHTGVRKSRPRARACLILPRGAMSVGQGVPLLIQAPLVSTELYLMLITVSLLKDGCALDSPREPGKYSSDLSPETRLSTDSDKDDGHDGNGGVAMTPKVTAT